MTVDHRNVRLTTSKVYKDDVSDIGYERQFGGSSIFIPDNVFTFESRDFAEVVTLQYRTLDQVLLLDTSNVKSSSDQQFHVGTKVMSTTVSPVAKKKFDPPIRLTLKNVRVRGCLFVFHLHYD